jgi:hypothetical protein
MSQYELTETQIKGDTMSEQETKQATAQDQSLAQVNQVINNAVASLMDVSNLLRDIPKLVAVNAQLAAQLAELKK